MAATVRVEGEIARAHAECGTGITWSLELRRGTRGSTWHREKPGAQPQYPCWPFRRVRVQPGDLISVLVGAREGNQSCDLTAVDLRLTDSWLRHTKRWSLCEPMLPATCSPEIRMRTPQDARTSGISTRNRSLAGNRDRLFPRDPCWHAGNPRLTSRKTTTCGTASAVC